MPTRSIDDRKRLLADPELHWKAGRSAHSLAAAWQDAQGFPRSFREAFGRAGLALEMLIGLPEHRVPLPGGTRASQTDLFVLARDTRDGSIVAIAVEGKVSESFGPIVGDWLRDDEAGGKTERLAFLLDTLGLDDSAGVQHLRYQLLHRTASAVIEARRFNAGRAMMIVHSFSAGADGYDDYAAFAQAVGATPEVARMSRGRDVGELELWTGWVPGEARQPVT